MGSGYCARCGRCFAERRVTVPIVALTAYGTTENRARAFQTGFDLYLTKPIAPQELKDALAAVVSPVPPAPVKRGKASPN
jgi:two-component system, OmpR family, response regulator